ncbi:MAG: metal-dependent transcriptional regulator [Candidatus Brocadiia bacterium]
MPGFSTTSRMEDYLEAVLALEGEDGEARVTDLAERLGVSKPTVSATLKSLESDGLVRHERYGGVRLTDRGRILARRTAANHRLLAGFLRDVLGVDEERADRDACAVEHHISPETRERLSRFVRFIEGCPRTGPGWLEHFRCFCEHDTAADEQPAECGATCRRRCMEEVGAAAGSCPPRSRAVPETPGNRG